VSELHIISLGAGVQSTTMALMAAHGEITPMPDAAIFADTGAEPRAVYEHLEWLMSGNVLPFPVHVVSKGNIRDDVFRLVREGEAARAEDGAPPAELLSDVGHLVGPAGGPRLNVWLRRKLGAGYRQRLPAGARAAVWIGISADEVYRMKPSREAWIDRVYPVYPLIDVRMSRGDCLEWMAAKGYTRPPRSACIFCPFDSDTEWRDIRDSDPEGWAGAVAFALDKGARPGFRNTKSELFVHRSLVPLDEVDLSTVEDG
tara:strand:- start:11 stop:784 length:774 start_codon:yes stop_codon:yes gene_type:complete